ncbi:MAG: hypothetical protein ACE5SW_08090 [Nitrososphaeraceae archaeon]
MSLVLSFLTFIIVIMISTSSLPNALFAEQFNDDKEYCSDYNGEWDIDKGECEFTDKGGKEAYTESICSDPEEGKHYPQLC